jgi:hypothetical protein
MWQDEGFIPDGDPDLAQRRLGLRSATSGATHAIRKRRSG